MFRKNTAGQFIHFQGVNSSTGGIISAVTWTVRRCIDGTFAAATGTVTEDGTTGWYKFAMSQADTNGNNIAFNFTGTGAIPQTVNIVTTACDPTSTAFGLSIAKTTNITGFNDIAATAVVSGGAITTSGGAVSTVTTATNVTTVNGLAANVITAASIAAAALNGKGDWNIGKTGYALSAAGVQAIWDALTSALTTVGSIGKLLVDNINATISSRMATYTQPTGFLAATFPATVASTTNITAGTITTVSGNVNGSVGSVTGAVGSVAAAVDISAGAVDLIWDEPTAGHATAGTTGKALTDAGSAGDPWATALPGAYGAGTAGKIVGDNINAPIATVDTVVDAIKAKTDSLTFTVAGKVDSNITHVIADPVQASSSKTTNWGGT